MSHANAPLTPTGRLRLAQCACKWGPTRAAELFGELPAGVVRELIRSSDAEGLLHGEVTSDLGCRQALLEGGALCRSRIPRSFATTLCMLPGTVSRASI